MPDHPLTFGTYLPQEWCPIFSQFEWADRMPAEKIFTEVGQYDLVHIGKSYCRVCGGYEHQKMLDAHTKVHRNEFKQFKQQVRKEQTAQQRDLLHTRNRERKLTGRITMAEKITAKQQGFPDEYLSEGGNFKLGMDARCKSDLVNSILSIKDPKMLHTFRADKARELLKVRGWEHYLTRKQEILEGKKTKSTEKVAAVKEKVATKKRGGLSRVKQEQPTGNADKLREQREAQFERDQATREDQFERDQETKEEGA